MNAYNAIIELLLPDARNALQLKEYPGYVSLNFLYFKGLKFSISNFISMAFPEPGPRVMMKSISFPSEVRQ